MTTPSDPKLRANEDQISQGTNRDRNPSYVEPDLGFAFKGPDPRTKDTTSGSESRTPTLTANVNDYGDAFTGAPPLSSEGMWLLNTMRLAGWKEPDRWAAQFMSQLAASSAKTPQQINELLLTAQQFAYKFAANPQLAFNTWKSELAGQDYTFTGPWFDNPDFFGDDSAMGGGYGYGGGAAAPVYTPPDRREIEYTVMGMLTMLVGQADKGLLTKYTDMYMKSHRRSWDNPNDGLKPWEDVKEGLRGESDYKRVHKLRPDYVDETEWVTLHQQTAASAGMLAGPDAERFAINQAQIGATAQTSAEAAGKQEFVRGRQTNQFRAKLAQAAAPLFQGLQ